MTCSRIDDGAYHDDGNGNDDDADDGGSGGSNGDDCCYRISVLANDKFRRFSAVCNERRVQY